MWIFTLLAHTVMTDAVRLVCTVTWYGLSMYCFGIVRLLCTVTWYGLIMYCFGIVTWNGRVYFVLLHDTVWLCTVTARLFCTVAWYIQIILYLSHACFFVFFWFCYCRVEVSPIYFSRIFFKTSSSVLLFIDPSTYLVALILYRDQDWDHIFMCSSQYWKFITFDFLLKI